MGNRNLLHFFTRVSRGQNIVDGLADAHKHPANLVQNNTEKKKSAEYYNIPLK